MVKIEVYFSPVCPHCPGAKKLVAEVAARYGGRVEVEEVNTFTAEGIKSGMTNEVMSVPTVFIDGEKRFEGFPVPEGDLVASIEAALAR
ncbi:MAG: thioredoxin family protein [Candidatus Bathyarchaeia archaeon]